MVSNKHLYFEKAMEEYIRFFLENRDYLQLQTIQESRANIHVYNVTKDQMSDRRFLKHMCYVDRFASIFLTLPYKYLNCGERVHFSNIRKIRYKLKSMDEINSLFGNTIDIFYNGKKILRKEIEIALFDNYFVVKMPSRYKDFTKLNILMRPFIRDVYSNKNEIRIDKYSINDANKNDFIAYADGKQTESFSIVDSGDYFTVRMNVSASNYELTFIRNLHRFGNTSLINQHLDLRSVRKRYPIPSNNIITFTNGLFVNMEFIPKTGNILKSAIPISDNFLVYYIYKEYDDEDNYYDDNYSWYANYNKNIMDIINSPTQLPEFMNKFYLFNKEISLSDFLANNYNDLNVYHTDRTKDSLAFNDELIQKVYQCIINNFPDNIFDVKHINLSEYDLEANTRYNNKEDNGSVSMQVDFVSKMYLFRVPNINNYRINVYLDGIRYFDYRYDDKIANVDYIYLTAFRVNKAKTITFEYVKTPYSSVRSIQLLGSNNKHLSVLNASVSGLIKSTFDERFIKVFEKKTVSGQPSYTKVNINNIRYDEKNDTLHLDSTTQFSANSIYVVSNNRFSRIDKFDTKKRGEGFDVTLKGYHESDVTKENFRIFKTGREIPSDYYTIIAPSGSNTDLKIHINIKYTIYEAIEIEYTPVEFLTIHKRRTLETDGKVDMYNKPYNNYGKEFVVDSPNQYYVLNGRRVLPMHYKIWCAKGLTLHDLNSVKHFDMKLNGDSLLLSLMNDFYNFYKTSPHLFSKFIVEIMNGKLTDDEKDCIDTNIDRTGELYWDLYQEFLKHNIISIGDNLPDYIAFKYNKLIDEGLNNTIMLDMAEEQLYWMPLDASMNDEASLKKILDLYYMLLDDMHSVQQIDPGDIPEDLYIKYKELFDNNVLVLQVPNFTLPTNNV